MNRPEEPLIEGDEGDFYGIAEYCSFWGCDPAYDRSPCNVGDGYMFYNFAVERDNPEFLAKFIPALERTIELKKEDEEEYSVDIDNLNIVLGYVKELLKYLQSK